MTLLRLASPSALLPLLAAGPAACVEADDEPGQAQDLATLGDDPCTTASAGSACTLAPARKACSSDADCGEGYYCDFGPSVPPIQQPGVCVVDSCWSDADCGKGYYCEFGPSVPPIPTPGSCIAEDPCPHAACDKVCRFGYLQDSAGCDLCECAPDPCSAYGDWASCSTVDSCVWVEFDHICPEGDPCGMCVTPWPG